MKYCNKRCISCKYSWQYPMYYSPCRYSQIGSQPVSGITNGCSSVSGIYKGTCDSKEHVIYDCWFPLSYFVDIWNYGTCPVTCYIYYTDGFYKKRESWTINPNGYHKFDLVDSILTVTLQCNPIGKYCDKEKNDNICKVNYWVH